MRSEIRGQKTEIRSHRSEARPHGLAFGVLFVLVAALLIPLFAHGCHFGDHDDEPLVIPQDQRSTPAR